MNLSPLELEILDTLHPTIGKSGREIHLLLNKNRKNKKDESLYGNIAPANVDPTSIYITITRLYNREYVTKTKEYRESREVSIYKISENGTRIKIKNQRNQQTQNIEGNLGFT